MTKNIFYACDILPTIHQTRCDLRFVIRTVSVLGTALKVRNNILKRKKKKSDTKKKKITCMGKRKLVQFRLR